MPCRAAVKFHLIVCSEHLVQRLTHSRCSAGGSTGAVVHRLPPAF